MNTPHISDNEYQPLYFRKNAINGVKVAGGIATRTSQSLHLFAIWGFLTESIDALARSTTNTID